MELQPLPTESPDQETKTCVQFELMNPLQNVSSNVEDEVVCPNRIFDDQMNIKREPVGECDRDFPEESLIDRIKEERLEHKDVPDHLLPGQPRDVVGKTAADRPVPVTLYKSLASETEFTDECVKSCRILEVGEHSSPSTTESGSIDNYGQTDQCSLYPNSTATKVDLSWVPKHELTHTGEKPFKCFMCQYSTAIRGELRVHERIHTVHKLFKCSFCSYSAVRKQGLRIHERTHTGEKPFKCSSCPYSTAVKGNLKVHKVRHTGDKPFKCSVCLFSAAGKRSLKLHERIHTGNRPFKCPLCPFSAVVKGTLKNHQITHTGKKQYKCSVCPYSTIRKGNLKVHELIHTGEKPFKCSFCSYSASSKGQLNNHERCHTVEKQFKCSLCPYSTYKKWSLAVHEKESHADVQYVRVALPR